MESKSVANKDVPKNSEMKSKLFKWGLLAFAFSFMLWIFAPLDIYYANINEFWFTAGQMLAVTAVCFAVMFIAVFGIFFGLSFIKKSDYIYAGFTGLLIYLYVQGNYIPRDYGVLDGKAIDWDSYVGYGIASIVLALVCIGLCVLLCVKFKDKISLIGKVVSAFLLAIQMVTIMTLAMQNMGGTKESADFINTEKDMLSLSADRNVVVFILDTFDAEYMDHLLEDDYDKYSDIFEDFTYYRDTLGAYPTTKASIPFILTNRWYENKEPFADYVQAAYADNEIYKNFEKNDFELGVYTDTQYLAKDGVDYVNIDSGEYYISDKYEFTKQIVKLVSLNYMPHQLKRFFVTDTDYISGLKQANTDCPVYSDKTPLFAEKLSEDGISVTKDGNVFRFYHLCGTHAPYTFGEDLTSAEDVKYTQYDEAAGSAEVVRRYIEQLKANGIYDNTTIIVTADHGHVGYAQNPLFMVKNVDEHHDFYVSDSMMSFEYLDDIWIALANNETVDEQFIDSCKPEYGDRRYLFYTWDNLWLKQYLPGMQEMLCKGNASDIDSLIETGVQFTDASVDYSYTLGTELGFINATTGYSYCHYGMGIGGHLDKIALFEFDLKDQTYDNIKVSVKFADKSANKPVTFYANDVLVAETADIRGKNVEFIIPKDYISDGTIELVLKGTNDKRSFDEVLRYIETITLTGSTDEFDPAQQCSAYKYQLGTKIEFASGNPCVYSHVVYGFYAAEPEQAWAHGDGFAMKFKIDDVSEDLIVDMSYSAHVGDQHTLVYANDTLIDDYIATTETKQFKIPAEYVKDGVLMLRFEFPDIVQTKVDMRFLALAIHELTIDKVSKDEQPSEIEPTDSDAKLYELGTKLIFSNSDLLSREYLYSGFYNAETEFTWTSGNTSIMKFNVGDVTKDLLVEMSYATHVGEQRVSLYANDNLIEEYLASGETTKTFTVPAEYINNGILTLRLELPDARTPESVGIGTDTRILALAFTEMTISECE